MNTTKLEIVWPEPGDGMPSERVPERCRESLTDPNPIGYPTRPYWHNLKEAGVDPPDDVDVNSVSLRPASARAFSDFGERSGRSIQSTGMPRASYSIEREREKTSSKTRTLSRDKFVEAGWEPAVSYSFEDELLDRLEPEPEQEAKLDLEQALSLLTPAERAVVQVMIQDEHGTYGKVTRTATTLGKNPKTVDALWRKALARLGRVLEAA